MGPSQWGGDYDFRWTSKQRDVCTLLRGNLSHLHGVYVLRESLGRTAGEQVYPYAHVSARERNNLSRIVGLV